MQELERKGVKVGLGTPIYESIHGTNHISHVKAMVNWTQYLCETVLLAVCGHGTAESRNAIVESSLEQKCTHTFFMDATCDIPLHALPRLLGHKGIAVISGVICCLAPMFEQKGGIMTNGEYAAPKLPFDVKVYEVDWCPLGCTLIDNSWFYKVGRPYFLDESHELGRMRIRQNKNHDISFCETIKKLGGKVCIDTGVLVPHGFGAIKIAPDPETTKGRIEVR